MLELVDRRFRKAVLVVDEESQSQDLQQQGDSDHTDKSHERGVILAEGSIRSEDRNQSGHHSDGVNKEARITESAITCGRQHESKDKEKDGQQKEDTVEHEDEQLQAGSLKCLHPSGRHDSPQSPQ